MSNCVSLWIFAVLCLVGIRMMIYLYCYSVMNKRKRKEYKKEKSFLKRWFFIDASNYVKNIHSKYEGKTIACKSTIVVLSVLNWVMHILFVLNTILFFGVLVDWTNDSVFKIGSIGYYISFLCILGAIATILYLERPRRLQRYRRKRKR